MSCWMDLGWDRRGSTFLPASHWPGPSPLRQTPRLLATPFRPTIISSAPMQALCSHSPTVSSNCGLVRCIVIRLALNSFIVLFSARNSLPRHPSGYGRYLHYTPRQGSWRYCLLCLWNRRVLRPAFLCWNRRGTSQGVHT